MTDTRITIEFDLEENGDLGELNIYLNPKARDWLVKELTKLSEHDDHLHLWSLAWTPEDVGLSQIPYRGKVIETAKILLRPDAWDQEHFPHVLEPQPTLDVPNIDPD